MKKLLFGAIAFLALTTLALAASIPYQVGPWDPANLGYYLNLVIQAVNQNVGTGAGVAAAKNFVDNGAMAISQRPNTINPSCGTTSGPGEINYDADRWTCDVNVTSGVGKLLIGTASSPPGFANYEGLYRLAGVLTQPVCAWQEIATYKSVQLQGQNVILSAYELALANLASDNGSTTFLTIIAGTGTDEGLGSLRGAQGMTASPAITPAWTGLSTLATVNATITTSWARYNTGVVSVPTTTKELAVGICFTPTAAAVAGTTDGLRFTGVQLEAVSAQNTGVPSAFENKQYSTDLLECEQYAYALPEAASGVAELTGQTLSTTAAQFALNFPIPMAVAPTLSSYGVAIASGTTYKVNQAGTLYNVSALAVFGANSVNSASFTVTAATMNNASGGATLQGLGGGNVAFLGADF